MPKPKNPSGDPLARYRAKRSAESTPEPFGPGAARPGVFVVHKHRARRLHYDLRLELGGTLRSWAIPKGPSFDPAVKRMAVHVEDHPVEYVDFEGLIPEGNYGAGAMIVWDRGTWVPLEDPDGGLARGKLLFELRGYKLQGVWTLVKTKGSSNEWLFIKKPDAHAAPEGTKRVSEASILSGLTVEDMQDGKDPSRDIAAEVAALGAPSARLDSSALRPMLAEVRAAPFSRAGWLFELKYDGFRLIAVRQDDAVRLIYRRGRDATRTFPDVERALARLPYPDFVLDGEVVVLDEAGRPSFQRLQKRVQLTSARDLERAAVQRPATYYAFDLLAFGGRDLRGLPLSARKGLLRKLLPERGPLRFSDHIETEGEAFFREVQKLGLEGIVAKRAAAPYRAGRSADWFKIRVDQTGDFVVIGYTRPKGLRSGFGALLLGGYEDGVLRHVGRVGSGFDEAELVDLQAALDAARVDRPPVQGPVLGTAGAVWVRPALVVEVRYKERTEDDLLRQPVFLRLRPDKAPEECVLSAAPGRRALAAEPEGAEDDDGAGAEDQAEAEDQVEAQAEAEAQEVEVHAAADQAAASGARRGDADVPFTNLDKVFWPEEGYTKRDLIEYYRAVSDILLPYLRDRPVVLTRYPDGISGKSFFQKDAPPFVPGWLRTERMWSEQAAREIDHFVCDDLASLLYLINLGSIVLHVWSSRLTTLQRPDWCILDLDPKQAPFAHVIELALAVRDLCAAIELDSFVKTSGSSGLHVLIPLGRQCTHEQSRLLAELLARVLVEEHPEIATITRAVGARGERVYLDYLQNGHGKLLVSAFSVRPLPGAPVSTPLAWDEVRPGLDPRAYTIATVPARLRGLASDPLSPVLDRRPDLPRALERLGARLGRPER